MKTCLYYFNAIKYHETGIGGHCFISIKIQPNEIGQVNGITHLGNIKNEIKH
jgi:hypothetical protein